MIKTLNPYSTTAKTAEIMSRYRPIAPKPELPDDTSAMSHKIRHSPYMRNLWPQLQARPSRTRKRGRAALSPPTLKRAKSHLWSPSHGLNNFVSVAGGLEISSTPSAANLVTLPLLPCAPSVPIVSNSNLTCMESQSRAIDLNSVAEIAVPEEKDLLKHLQGAPLSTSSVIAPQPIRPIGSSISVGCITNLISPMQAPKKAEEVEEEVESEALPAVVSDSNNKVRIANSAYSEMIGQPECPWLDSMVKRGGKRICGEVRLRLSDSGLPLPHESNGFSCWVRIEWGSEGKNKSIKAFCDVIRLSCQSKDYLFTWRFHTNKREASQSSTNV